MDTVEKVAPGLTAREREFLDAVLHERRLKSADREEDKIRQRMRRLGYAEVIMNPRRWVLTIKGIHLMTS